MAVRPRRRGGGDAPGRRARGRGRARSRTRTACRSRWWPSATASSTTRGEALVAAAREAMVNAAKFGARRAGRRLRRGRTTDGRGVRARPRARASTPPPCPADRRGVRESIVGRMERHGGRARDHAARPAAAPRSSWCWSGRDVTRRPRVVIVDDHQLFRAGVRAELEALRRGRRRRRDGRRGGGDDRERRARRRAARRAHARRRRRSR